MSELEIMALFTPTEDHVHSVEDLLKAAVEPSRAEWQDALPGRDYAPAC